MWTLWTQVTLPACLTCTASKALILLIDTVDPRGLSQQTFSFKLSESTFLCHVARRAPSAWDQHCSPSHWIHQSASHGTASTVFWGNLLWLSESDKRWWRQAWCRCFNLSCRRLWWENCCVFYHVVCGLFGAYRIQNIFYRASVKPLDGWVHNKFI